MRTMPFRTGILAPVAAIVLLAGCGDEAAGPPEPEPDPRDPNGTNIPLDVTDPDALLDSYGRALEARDLSVYTALLAEPGDLGTDDPGFRFFIRDDEADLFPWLSDAWWESADELAMMGNMFDPDFGGSEPPVQSIDLSSMVRIRRSKMDDHGFPVAELTADAIITVLTGPNAGFTADTKLILEMGHDSGGHLRIRMIREISRFAGRGVEQQSWGQIKNLYY